MTGSAQTWSEAVRLYLLLGEKKKERVWERKGLGVLPERICRSGGWRISIFEYFSVRRGSPDALHTASIFMWIFGRFWSDLGSLLGSIWAPKSLKIEKKTVPNRCSVLGQVFDRFFNGF